MAIAHHIPPAWSMVFCKLEAGVTLRWRRRNPRITQGGVGDTSPVSLCFFPASPTTMATPASALSSHERTRVEDYLNDKLQVSADLDSLDSLLSSLRAQHELQRKQVPRSSLLH